MNVKSLLAVVGFIATLSLLTSCNQDCLTDQQNPVENPWHQDDHAFFKVDIQDSLQLYDFYIHVRNTVEYQNANIFFFLTTHFPNGQIARDTVECFLADRMGNWYGSGVGKYRDNKILFKRNGRFPMCGMYQFEFEQAMRTDDGYLEGIESIGIRIEESKIN